MDLMFDGLSEAGGDSCAQKGAASEANDSETVAPQPEASDPSPGELEDPDALRDLEDFEDGELLFPESADFSAETPAGEQQAPATPEPASPFAAVPKQLRSALENRGFESLSAVQSAALEVRGRGLDLQISSQTGSGKTVALGLVMADFLASDDESDESWERPAGPQALVIVPTRELAGQVAEELGWLFAGVPRTQVVAVTGGTPVYRERQVLSRTPRVLVGTPGRLLDHISSGNLDLSAVRELILDEADQMLDMGFREELDGILEATSTERRTHMVSATFPAGIMRLAERYQRDPHAIEGTRLGDANNDIEHIGYLVEAKQRYDVLVNLLLDSEGERTLVFVERRAEAVLVADRLADDGFPALPLSGELAQSQRERTLAAFRSGQATVLVATDVAARGLDVPDVAMVVHSSPPIDSQIYTHRSGRTGRAGKSGRSVLFAAPNRRRRANRLVGEAGIDLAWERPPSAEEVRSRRRLREDAKLAENLDRALEAGVDEQQRARAAKLLEDRSAADVVAALLSQIEPKGRAEPRDVGRNDYEIPTRRHGGRDDRDGGRGGYGDRSSSRSNFGGGNQGGYEPRGRDRGPRSMDRDAVRFFINWGRNQGANPSRLLAAICRRGEVAGEHIGAIAIHPNAATFDVHSEVAERFERLAGRRDARDPQTFIRRDRGPIRN